MNFSMNGDCGSDAATNKFDNAHKIHDLSKSFEKHVSFGDAQAKPRCSTEGGSVDARDQRADLSFQGNQQNEDEDSDVNVGDSSYGEEENDKVYEYNNEIERGRQLFYNRYARSQRRRRSSLSTITKSTYTAYISLHNKSKYARIEDKFERGHSAVWGSFFDVNNLRWGYADDFSTTRYSQLFPRRFSLINDVSAAAYEVLREEELTKLGQMEQFAENKIIQVRSEKEVTKAMRRSFKQRPSFRKID